ncbi:DUF2000 domain-containing protein [Candidatus Stoquefichus sp. SB1]|uniref:DUF2000 domain-containing protein n=1 Tax=Candidatus Stoquefichus sp. SB1 TaxID=1658109 RepID=UPI00067E7999|nr:DUF2000 domain-containing protein [Candidatus Stoquefichus sp. SB1]
MNIQNEKCVMVLNEELPLGILANTAGIMGITLGKYIPETVGVTVLDKSQHPHLGIITTPVPILKTTQDKIKQIRQQLYLPDFKELIVVDFSDVAQSCNVYDEYIEKASQTLEDDFTYFGIAIYGNKKLVNKLTGSLPLLR